MSFTFKVAELNLALEYSFKCANSRHHCLFTDIDECLQVPEICELGSCTNIGGGGLYTCACPPGTISTGTNTDNSLRCIGKLVAGFDIYHSFIFPKILMSVQWNLMCVDHWEHV